MAIAATLQQEEDEQKLQLGQVLTLATLFSTCVEAFGLIHPSKDFEKSQQLLLTKLGVQQARLLIWGDVVGIHAPPPPFPTHIVPSHPGPLNPDPKEPVYFGVRDVKLDEPAKRKEVEERLNEIVYRPSHLGREEMMEKYGLKPPKKFSSIYQPAFDATRLEAFREKYGLLQDLADLYNVRANRQSLSMTSSHWQIYDTTKFEAFVQLVKDNIDPLVKLLDSAEAVDRGMKMDIRSLVWHPETLSRAMAAKDMSKLRLLREACENEYPDYATAADNALKYLDSEFKATYMAARKPAAQLPKSKANGEHKHEEQKRPSFFNWFRSSSGKKSTLAVPVDESQRTMSESGPSKTPQDVTEEPVRAMSMSAIH
jgi:hypothetical protein